EAGVGEKAREQGAEIAAGADEDVTALKRITGGRADEATVAGRLDLRRNGPWQVLASQRVDHPRQQAIEELARLDAEVVGEVEAADAAVGVYRGVERDGLPPVEHPAGVSAGGA